MTAYQLNELEALISLGFCCLVTNEWQKLLFAMYSILCLIIMALGGAA